MAVQNLCYMFFETDLVLFSKIGKILEIFGKLEQIKSFMTTPGYLRKISSS